MCRLTAKYDRLFYKVRYINKIKKLMIQNNLKQRLLKARKWTIIGVSLLVIFIVTLLIYGYGGMHGSDKVKTWLGLSACGKFGDQYMLIDKEYLIFAQVTYQDVNYWGKSIRAEHAAKGCDNQIQSIDLKVKWPERKAAGEGYHLDSKNKNEMTIALNQHSVWRDEWRSKSSFNDIWALNWKLRNNFDGVEVTEEWRNLTKKWDSELELFVIDVAGGKTLQVKFIDKKLRKTRSVW